MKKLYALILFVVASTFANAQGIWTQKATAPQRKFAVGFAIGAKGYMCTGIDYFSIMRTVLYLCLAFVSADRISSYLPPERKFAKR